MRETFLIIIKPEGIQSLLSAKLDLSIAYINILFWKLLKAVSMASQASGPFRDWLVRPMATYLQQDGNSCLHTPLKDQASKSILLGNRIEKEHQAEKLASSLTVLGRVAEFVLKYSARFGGGAWGGRG